MDSLIKCGGVTRTHLMNQLQLLLNRSRGKSYSSGGYTLHAHHGPQLQAVQFWGVARREKGDVGVLEADATWRESKPIFQTLCFVVGLRPAQRPGTIHGQRL